ncbi:MAG: hypothetical protein VZS44_12380 [Bacilli bacterium]|nr:hypothetical protein [Bacilli bacterium]
MNNELTLFNANQNSNIYCSIVAKDNDEKKKLFNALENCDLLLNDCVGQKIKMKDLYIEAYENEDEDSGEVKTKYRTIIFDADGQTYATGSYGIYNILNKIVAIYGLPSNWAEPVEVEVIKKATRDGKQSLSLKLV